MKFAVVLSIILVELLVAVPQAEAFTGLKSTYREGQPGWRRMRRNAAKRKRLEANALRAQKAALKAPPVERTGIQRFTYDYWYPTSMHATGLLQTAKNAMIKEKVNRLVVAITANGEDQFSWFVTKKADNTFEVTADTLASAELAGVQFLPHSSGREFRDVEQHNRKVITIFGLIYPDANDLMVRDFLSRSKAAMEFEKLERLMAVVTDYEGKELYTYLLFRNGDGKVVIGADNFKSAEMGRVELALTLLSCEGLVE